MLCLVRYKNRMKDSILNPYAGRSWLPYRQLEQFLDGAGEASVEAWLSDALQPLALPVEFARKLHAAVRDTAAAVPAGVSQLRVLVFLPDLHTVGGQTWGFFQTVKTVNSGDSSTGGTYEIAFYLYVEGATR